jgi:hypothetical protein
VVANSTGGQGSRRAVAPSDDDDYVCSLSFFSIQAVSYHCLNGLKEATEELPSWHNRFPGLETNGCF